MDHCPYYNKHLWDFLYKKMYYNLLNESIIEKFKNGI